MKNARVKVLGYNILCQRNKSLPITEAGSAVLDHWRYGFIGEISGSYGGEHKDDSRLGYTAM
jgi:hypothetical protein